jgi:hypothetical protein
MKLPKDFGRIKMEEEMLKADAKRRKQEWDEEQSDGGIVFIIAIVVAILVADFVLRIIY